MWAHGPVKSESAVLNYCRSATTHESNMYQWSGHGRSSSFYRPAPGVVLLWNADRFI